MGKLSFIVFTMPRTKSYWLSKFLSYKGFDCKHDHLYQLNTHPWMVGTVETGQIPFWRDIKQEYPDARIVTVRRNFDEIATSLEEIGIPRTKTEIIMDMEYYSVCMDNLEKLYPNTLALTYNELNTEEGCKKVFEFLMQVPFDKDWYNYMKDQNLQEDNSKILELFN